MQQLQQQVKYFEVEACRCGLWMSDVDVTEWM